MRATRTYTSDIRNKQALQTRKKILNAARNLFKANGYESTTIDAIAVKAGVSSPTIYAVFRSKKEILKELVYSVKFGQRYQEAVQRVLSETNPRLRLLRVSAVARSVHDTSGDGLDLFRGAGVVSPEIRSIENELEQRRYELQKPVINLLCERRALKTGISKRQARDILWCLTGREMYRMLVLEKNWTSNEYERWLGQILVHTLLNSRNSAGS